ncbi:hypothetical protein SB658_27305, partial [Bacillus sp. SIMBA_008]|uniref:hypothetical protein n=1 Tax=Bacillus sp. SIMBA_008 TaxID=3085757 RepID=UPI00397923F1
SAGQNGYLNICYNDSPTDLFNSLNGSPNTGGTWSPALASRSGVFDPKKDLSGIYKYTILNSSCENSISEVAVNVLKLP